MGVPNSCLFCRFHDTSGPTVHTYQSLATSADNVFGQNASSPLGSVNIAKQHNGKVTASPWKLWCQSYHVSVYVVLFGNFVIMDISRF